MGCCCPSQVVVQGQPDGGRPLTQQYGNAGPERDLYTKSPSHSHSKDNHQGGGHGDAAAAAAAAGALGVAGGAAAGHHMGSNQHGSGSGGGGGGGGNHGHAIEMYGDEEDGAPEDGAPPEEDGGDGEGPPPEDGGEDGGDGPPPEDQGPAEDAPEDAPPPEDGGDAPPEDMDEAIDMYGAAEPKDDDFNKRDDWGKGRAVSVAIDMFDTMRKYLFGSNDYDYDYDYKKLMDTSGNVINGVSMNGGAYTTSMDTTIEMNGELSDYSENSDNSSGSGGVSDGDGESSNDLFERRPFWRKSNKKRNLSKMVTIVTQCSLDRMRQLNNMCLMWNGIISVSVYVPNGEKTDELGRLEALFNRVENNINNAYKCVLDIHLLYREENHGSQWYPINTLRNLSLDNSFSSYLFLLDIDFIPSKNLQTYVMNAINNNGDLINDNKFALVIPAFEFKKDIRRIRSINEYPLTKSKLINNKYNQTVSGFHLNSFKFGHYATNYSKWFATNESERVNDSNSIYPISYEMYYEPYVIVSNNSNLRRYDERFTGYGFNKIVHIAGLSIVDKYNFYVLKDGFVVAPMHSKSNDFNKTYRNKDTQKRKERKMHLSKLATIAFNEMYAIQAE